MISCNFLSDIVAGIEIDMIKNLDKLFIFTKIEDFEKGDEYIGQKSFELLYLYNKNHF